MIIAGALHLVRQHGLLDAKTMVAKNVKVSGGGALRESSKNLGEAGRNLGEAGGNLGEAGRNLGDNCRNWGNLAGTRGGRHRQAAFALWREVMGANSVTRVMLALV